MQRALHNNLAVSVGKADILFTCRRYTDIAEKLGGQEEAADAMGKLLRNVASRFADPEATLEVSSRKY